MFHNALRAYQPRARPRHALCLDEKYVGDLTVPTMVRHGPRGAPTPSYQVPSFESTETPPEVPWSPFSGQISVTPVTSRVVTVYPGLTGLERQGPVGLPI